MIAFLFPGQGAQKPGMLRALAALPGASAAIATAGEVLGRDLVADDTAAGYAGTAGAQLALFVAGVAGAEALAVAGVRPDAVAGHSIGAYAAAVVAGALDVATALRVVDLRGRAMARAFPAGYGMGAISGLDETRVAQLAAAHAASGEAVYAANVNALDQIAVAGTLAGVDAVLAAALASGARAARRLDVAVPSHCTLMRDVRAALAQALEPAAVHPARIPYATNTTGRLVRDAPRIRADLTDNVDRPVRWADATRVLYESGVRRFIEMCPGTILTDLAAAAFPDARAVALETSGLASAVALSRRS